MLLFSDARRHHESAQLSFVGGILVDDLKKGEIFHTIKCSSHPSRRPENQVEQLKYEPQASQLTKQKYCAPRIEFS